MGSADVVILLLGASFAVHCATACVLLTLRTGRSMAESILAGGAAAASTFSIWLTVLQLYPP